MINKLKNFYDGIASSYDSEQDEYGFVRAPEWDIVFKTIKNIASKEHSLLDIGAGTGRFTIEAARFVKEAVAIDISEKMLDKLLQKTNERGMTNIKTICGDFLDTPFTDRFDIIISLSAIEYIKNPKALFSKIASILAPGGHLVLTTSHDTFFRWWGRLGNYFRQGTFMEAYSKKKMERLILGNALKLKEMKDIGLKSRFIKGILLFVYATK